MENRGGTIAESIKFAKRIYYLLGKIQKNRAVEENVVDGSLIMEEE